MPTSHIRSLQAGFGISLLILIATSAASFISINNLIFSSREVNHTNTILKELENTISYAKDAETGQRGYVATGDRVFLDPYYGAYEKTMKSLDTVRQLTIDNASQQKKVTELKAAMEERFGYLQRSVDQKLLDVNEMRKGKVLMDQARALVSNMQQTEEKLLAERTSSLNRFSAFTPLLIIIAGLIALFTTVYFYRKVDENFRDRTRLAEALQQKDREITRRIDIIRNIAASISAGDYKMRLNDEEKDGLGNLSASLNAMAASLDRSFTELSNKEWLQTGLARLNDEMAGEKDIITLTNTIMDQLATYTGSQVGAFYLLEHASTLVLKSGYAYRLDTPTQTVNVGEGIVGQVALNKKEIIVSGIEENDFLVSFGTANLKPRHIVAIPILFEGKIKAVVELGSLEAYTDLDIEFLTSASENIGIAVNMSLNRTRLQELLEETQAQSEELQSQQTELESLNTELEAQAEKLQASEEELKVQQEELLETNNELQERSRLLEEKNDLVLRRNLEIQKKSEELALSAKYKSEFLANMSHELRTPLNSILLLSRLLGENNEQNLKPDQIEYAKVIQSSGNSLLLLIDDILDLSKIESGKMELEYEPISLHEIARDMQLIFQPLAAERNIALIVKADDQLPPTIETDRLRLEQIIKNLVSNAIKFTDQGSVSLEFKPSPKLKDFVDITVQDTGIGIAAEKQSLIFEAFQQEDGSTRRKYGGTGLGLSISRQLALLLKGDISLKSEQGKGSTFTLTIPVSKELSVQSQAASPAYEEEPAPASAAAKEPSSPEYLAGHIPAEIPDDRNSLSKDDKIMLIIEDDTAFANALIDFTRKKGYKAIVAVRGDHGIELARKYLPVGILLDIQLPVKNGWEVMEELKNDRQTRHIPVHIMSSFEVKKQSLTSGAIDFISKPIASEQIDTVFEKIEFYLKRDSRKVLIIEDNSKHAEALSYFLGSNQIHSVISGSISEGLDSLRQKEVDCVILDMGIPDATAYETMETLKKEKGLDSIPVIIFTGKSLSRNEEMRIKKYADSIVVKTAHSYRRILDEVSLFLHLVEENQKSKQAGAQKLKPLGEVLKNKTVLVADDDVRNIFSLTRVLEQHQMQVVPAINGKEALVALEEKPGIDIVLMDMMMPELDGYDTIARIRSQHKWKSIPIIAVTAKAMTGDREKCIQAGASDYISKPVDLDQLISLLRIWLYDTAAKRNV